MGSIYTEPKTQVSYLIIFGGLRLKKLNPSFHLSESPVTEQLTEISINSSLIYVGSGQVILSNRVICVDLSTYSWRNILLFSERDVEKRCGGVTVISGTKLFVFGGLVQQVFFFLLLILALGSGGSDQSYL